MNSELFGPRRRALITQEVVDTGHWAGAAQGLKIRFDILPLAGGRRIAWSVKGQTWSDKGITGTVFDAFDEIGRKAARKDAAREQAPFQGGLF
jgi:hypothetical protein